MGSILAPKNKILGFLTRLFFYIISYYKPAKDYVTQMEIQNLNLHLMMGFYGKQIIMKKIN